MDEPSERLRERIEAACRAVEGRLAEDLPLEDLAREADLSPFHFHRLFRALTGETVRGYARRLRLERAAHRLEAGDAGLLELALDSGYGSHEAFTRAFKRHFGVAPRDYRRDLARAAAEPMAPADLRFQKTAPCTVARVRHVGPYSEVGEAWAQLMKWGWSKLLFGSPATFGRAHDDPEVTAPERLRYDACMVVAPGTRTKHKVVLDDLPGQQFAIATHLGDYASIGDTYSALFAAILDRESGGTGRWRLGDPPAREVYMNDPRKTKPSELLTEVWMPVLPV